MAVIYSKKSRQSPLSTLLRRMAVLWIVSNDLFFILIYIEAFNFMLDDGNIQLKMDDAAAVESLSPADSRPVDGK
jgi:hypothetical protein